MIDWPVALDFASRQAFWTILVGLVSNSCCAILGCFLVLRRMSMLGDAISHAVLPGLALAFIVTGTTDALPMFIGAAVFAMLMAGMSRLLTTWGHTSEESGLGIVFTAFFALGILLIQLFAENVHLDRDAVLEGAIDYVTLDTMIFAGREWPVSLFVTGAVLLAVLVWLGLFWKEIKSATFDPVYATAIGLHGQRILTMLIILVALCVVAAFKVVGSVLVVAMLVVPAASAQLMSQRLSSMVKLSVLFACAATVAGYSLAWATNNNGAGMMAMMAGVGYLGALLFSPTQGLVLTRLHRRSLQESIAVEDVLGTLYRWEEAQRAVASEESTPVEPSLSLGELRELAGDASRETVLRQLQRAGLLEKIESETFQLTDLGRQQGQRIVRGHRLWESLLDSEFVLPDDHLHEAAHQMEHYLDEESHNQLSAQLGAPTADPHGRQIPPETTEPPR